MLLSISSTKGLNCRNPYNRGTSFQMPCNRTQLKARSKGFARDEHVPDLLLFSPETRFHEDPVYHTGKIILQDKASCFPATVLAQDIGDGDVIDATAAPGNKTSHLSALMNNKGKVGCLYIAISCAGI